MYNEDKTIVLLFNGEIYNFEDLRRELAQAHVFKSRSDTEVIVHAYEEWGIECLQKFNGDFAIFLWDKKKEKVYLCVDRFAVKHLYYAIEAGVLVFGSEPKSLLCHPRIKREIDSSALQFYMIFGYIPHSLSIFRGFKRVPAGTYVECDLRTGVTEPRRYYQLPRTSLSASQNPPSTDDVISLFRKSIKRRLVSDVPVGLFLSSGIDSSSILRFMREEYRGTLHTFTVGFVDNNNQDEVEEATAFSKELGATPHSVVCSLDDVLNGLLEVTRILDEPFADVSIVPTFLVSKEAHKHVKVVLSGDGADELLGGYETYIADVYLRKYGILGDALTKLRPVIDNLPEVFHEDVNPFFALKQLARIRTKNPFIRHFLLKAAFSPHDLTRILTPHYQGKQGGLFDAILEEVPEDAGNDFLNSILMVDQAISLQSDMLMKIDCASMANSLEVRVPFLDHEFAELVSRIPGNEKMKGTEMKHLWRKVLRGYLPDSILDRRKLGFGIPVKPLLEKLKPVLDLLLSQDRIEAQGIFQFHHVQRIMSEHFEKGHDQRKKLWTLLAFQLWYYNFFSSETGLAGLIREAVETNPSRREVAATNLKVRTNVSVQFNPSSNSAR